MTTLPDDDPFAVLEDARVATVLRRLYSEANRQHLSIIGHFLPHALSYLRRRFIPFADSEMDGFYADKYIAIIEDQGAFAYLTARALRARTVVEFGTSFGLSTLWLAAAVRANGGGRVVTTEIVPAKARVARRNFEDAGLADLIDVREGNAIESLAADPSDIDFVLNDGFPMRALDIVRLLTPRIRPGGVVLTDDVGGLRGNFADYLAYMRDRANGFDSMSIPLKTGTEYSVRR
ncbi:MAG: class I SAM-dependent methyltransferase [Xanthobacteraceae bacterium]|nr:class I SAM-dependent methyltransferase [Xanthobacteraceae bacterium]